MRRSRKRPATYSRDPHAEYALEVTGKGSKWLWEIRNVPQNRSARRSPRVYASREEAQKEGDEALRLLLRIINDQLARHTERKASSD